MLNPKSKSKNEHEKQVISLSCKWTHLAGRRLHHAVVRAHYASIWLGNRWLSVDGGWLGLGRRWGKSQERLGSTWAKVWKGQLGTGQGDCYLERDRDKMLNTWPTVTCPLIVTFRVTTVYFEQWQMMKTKSRFTWELLVFTCCIAELGDCVLL